MLLSHEMASVFFQIEANHCRPNGAGNRSLDPPNLVLDNSLDTIPDEIVIRDSHRNRPVR